jgi:hypothetical protein
MGENTNGYMAFGVPTFGHLTIFLSFFFFFYQFPYSYPLVNVGFPGLLGWYEYMLAVLESHSRVSVQAEPKH